MAKKTQTKKKSDKLQPLKYALCAASAGIIQIVSFTLLQLFIKNDGTMWFMIEMPIGDFISTTIALALSILWNFTLNRKFTFKDAGNVPKAMVLAFIFYIPFYPFQTWYVPTVKAALMAHMPSLELLSAVIAEGTVMAMNFVLEFIWDKFVVFRKPKQEKEKKEPSLRETQSDGAKESESAEEDAAKVLREIEDANIDLATVFSQMEEDDD